MKGTGKICAFLDILGCIFRNRCRNLGMIYITAWPTGIGYDM